MRERLTQLIDKPVTIRTLPEKPSWEPIQGVVFDVREDAVDVLIDAGVMKTVRLAMIVDVSLSHMRAREMHLEDAPDHEDYRSAKRRLFEAEEYVVVQQPKAAIEARAAEAAALLRRVRAAAPRHRGVARRLQRAHFLATGRYDYEQHPDVTGGDVDDEDFEDAKAGAAELEKALKARRPEKEVALLIRDTARRAARALARLPNHKDLASWFDRAEAIRNKLSPAIQVEADVAAPFQRG